MLKGFYFQFKVRIRCTHSKCLERTETMSNHPGNTKSLEKSRKPGSGRPKGAKNINSAAASKKLEEVGFDPIEMMVTKYRYIEDQLDNHHSGKVKLGGGAYAQLVAVQGNLINNLMAYGYKKVPEKVEQEITTKKPIAIRLTPVSKKE